MPNKQAVADLIRQAIESDPTSTQASIAALLGVQPPTVNKWAQAKALPAFDRWPEVETALGLPSGSIEEAYRTPVTQPLDAMEKRMALLERQVVELRSLVKKITSE